MILIIFNQILELFKSILTFMVSCYVGPTPHGKVFSFYIGRRPIYLFLVCEAAQWEGFGFIK